MIDGRLGDFGRFEALTFDCYGTLIDWETGLTNAFRPIFRGRGVEAAADAVLERFARPRGGRRSRPVPALPGRAGGRSSRRDRRVRCRANRRRDRGVPGSVGEWPAFPDLAAALARLRERFKLGVITNCDDDLFAASLPRLGVAFDWVVTAQQVRRLQAEHAQLRGGLRADRPPTRPDPAHRAKPLPRPRAGQKPGLATVWIDRRSDRSGGGATPPASASPDATFNDMASFADAATG